MRQNLLQFLREGNDPWSRNSTRCANTVPVTIFVIGLLILLGLPGPSSAAHFLEPIENVTVTVGRDASLACSVGNLGNHSVGWIHLKRQMIVAVHSRMITRISRYSVTHDSHSTWTLRITGVTEEDRGYYMCQINTDPALSQVGYLQVVVPPVIVDTESSPSEIQVREKKNVTLRCSAKGFPDPNIRWRREDGAMIYARNRTPELVHEGEVLALEHVSRTHMGAYLCIASNRVPPSVSKRIILKVEFPPQIHVPNQLVGVPTGDNVTVECHVEAFPKAISYWVKDKNMIMNSSKYRSHSEETLYRIHMKLTVFNFTKQDNTTYVCVAKNSLGETEGTIRLNEIYIPPKAKGIRSGGESLNQEIVAAPPSPDEELEISVENGSAEAADSPSERNEEAMIPQPNFPIDQGFRSTIASRAARPSTGGRTGALSGPLGAWLLLWVKYFSVSGKPNLYPSFLV